MKKTATESSRLDVCCSSLFDETRSKIQKAIKDNQVKVNGIIIDSPSFKVKEGDEIEYEKKEIKAPAVEKPTDTIELNYVYKDEDIAIIDKPRGLVVHPAPGHKNDTLVNYLFDEEGFDFDREKSDDIRPGIVHRIDKDTSGLLAVALNEESQRVLSEEVREGDFHRSYLALVYGNVPDRKFRIEIPLTRPNHTERKALVDTYKGREAITHCVTLGNNGKVSLLKCTLETGRTHQIRAHLSYIGFPIVGDTLYGRHDDPIAKKGQALHAYSLSLIHPRTLKRMTFYSPIDDYMKSLLIEFYKKTK